jgi:kexin
VSKPHAAALTAFLSQHSGQRDAPAGRNGLDSILGWQILVPRDSLQNREAPPLLEVDTSSWVQDEEAVRLQQNLMSTLRIVDPGFTQQWHLFNTIQLGQDMNVSGVWLEGVTGKGVVTAVIDNGLDSSSEDLRANYYAPGSYDFNNQKPNPQPNIDETHGTRCAGEIAAARNGFCGVGIAYDSKVAGIRLLSGPIDESDEAAALNYRFDEIDIHSCSWGPPDSGGAMAGPGPLVQRAFMNGVQNGRHGKGSIYVFAAGNGGYLGDNCNFDGYTNSIYTITIGAVTREGRHAEYTEPCAAQLAVAYSSAAYKSEGLDAIYTTDVGVDKCTHAHGGTSAAGPLAAGALALALSVRPELTWRDVQYLLYETAVPMDEGKCQRGHVL